MFGVHGRGGSSNLIAVEWVSVEGIMGIVCSNTIFIRQLCSIQLADPKIFKVSEITFTSYQFIIPQVTSSLFT